MIARAGESLGRRVRALGSSSLLQGSFLLMSGTVFSQAIFVAASPLLTRVFGFTDFGVLANYNAWVAVLALAGCLRYELAIIVARDEETATRAVALAAVLMLASSLAYLLVATFVRWSGPTGGYLGDIVGFVLLIPAGVVFANLSSIFVQLNVRAGRFARLALVGGVQAAFAVSIQLVLGWLKYPDGIIVGMLAGSILYAALLGWLLARDGTLVPARLRAGLRSLGHTAREFANFPRYALGADALGLLSLSFTPVLLSAMFNPAVAGIYAFSMRVVRLPMLVVSTAIAGVLRKSGMDQLKRTGSLQSLHRSVVTGLIAVGIIPCVLAVPLAPDLFALVFGAEWVEAGRVVRVLAPGILLEFVAFPMSTLFLITDNQKVMLRLQLVGTTSLFAAIAVGRYVLDDFMETCELISASMVVVNLASIVAAGRIARTHRPPAPPGA